MAKKPSQRNAGQVRIIGGQWRGRKLSVADLPGLRPSSDRVRETLFNWLQGVLPGAVCLDAFAGSGALGFEAASRGARQLVLLEKHPRCAEVLRAQIKLLRAEAHVSLQQTDALTWLEKTPQAPAPFDLVFLDPPFAADLLPAACAALNRPGWLKPKAWIYIETPREAEPPQWPPHWQVRKTTQTRQVSAYLCVVESA